MPALNHKEPQDEESKQTEDWEDENLLILKKVSDTNKETDVE